LITTSLPQKSNPLLTMKLTKHRQAILDTLAHHNGAISAQSLHTCLPHINLVTIYRTLELFTEQGMIRKLFLDGTEAVYEYQQHPHHHAICTDCHSVIHFDTKTDALKQLLTKKGFSVESIDITVRGRCKNDHKKAALPGS
jgi:Fur family transcriptional regulator, ferric uptake regulator